MLFEQKAFLELDCSISVADVLTLIVEVFLAIYVARVLESGIQESRTEKDFYIKELENVSEIFSNLEKDLSQLTLSFDNVVSDIGRSTRILNRFWKNISAYEKHFEKNNQTSYNNIVDSIKRVSALLTDAKEWELIEGVNPIIIKKRKIYLNKTVLAIIENQIGAVKDAVFEMKMLVNRRQAI